MTTESKSTGLSYGWWEKKRSGDLPKTLGHPANYVLTIPELNEYLAILEQQHTSITKEMNAVRFNIRARTMPPMLNWTSGGALPRCTTLVDVMTFILERGRAVKALTEMLVAASKQRTEERKQEAPEAALRG